MTRKHSDKVEMDFIEWLDPKLKKRGWGPSDLSKASEAAGHKISRGQFSHIINGTRQAGPEACIAIAHALGLSREEVFRARGWLAGQPINSRPSYLDPRAERLAQKVTALPFDSREAALDAMEPMLETVNRLTHKVNQLTQIRESPAEYGGSPQ